MTPEPTRDNLGDLLVIIYAEFMRLYGNEDIAAVATAAVLNDILSDVGNPEAGA